jgi:hypothetical protein
VPDVLSYVPQWLTYGSLSQCMVTYSFTNHQALSVIWALHNSYFDVNSTVSTGKLGAYEVGQVPGSLPKLFSVAVPVMVDLMELPVAVGVGVGEGV